LGEQELGLCEDLEKRLDEVKSPISPHRRLSQTEMNTNQRIAGRLTPDDMSDASPTRGDQDRLEKETN